MLSSRSETRRIRSRRLILAALALTALVVFKPFGGARAQDESTARDAAHGAATEVQSAAQPHLETVHESVPPGKEGHGEAGGHGEGHGGGGHTDPVAAVLLELMFILLAAKIGGHVFDKIGQPAVLGELVFGVLIGSVTLWAPGTSVALAIEGMRETGSYIDILARIGVILLLFEVGLESDVFDMMKVGVASLIVATFGVIAPFVLGYFVSSFFIDTAPPGVPLWHVHLFIGATLTATSVGITARVLKDLGKIHTNEAKIVLGAAVIDDVMGLIILAVVSGIIASDVNAAAGVAESMGTGMLATIITAKALIFMVAAIFLGLYLAPYGFKIIANLRGTGLLISSAVIFCFGVSYVANFIGLAPIVGAFAAGLVLGEAHIKHFTEASNGKKSLENLLHPLSAFLVPVFFVLMGIQVRLETFAEVSVLVVAALLTLAAIVGKQVCGLGIFGVKADRLSVGLGMIPRGEVGLIFASIGKGLGVVDNATFSAVVIMVIVTTLVTPPLLKWSLMRKAAGGDAAPESAA